MEVNQPYKDRPVNVQVESIVKTVQSIAKLPEEILESHSRDDTLRGQKVRCMQTSYYPLHRLVFGLARVIRLSLLPN